jgi:hypothetical protein
MAGLIAQDTKNKGPMGIVPIGPCKPFSFGSSTQRGPWAPFFFVIIIVNVATSETHMTLYLYIYHIIPSLSSPLRQCQDLDRIGLRGYYC